MGRWTAAFEGTPLLHGAAAMGRWAAAWADGLPPLPPPLSKDRRFCMACSDELSNSGESMIYCNECAFLGECDICGNNGCVGCDKVLCWKVLTAGTGVVTGVNRLGAGECAMGNAEGAGCMDRADDEEATAGANALCILAATSLSEALACAEDKAKEEEAAVAEQGRCFLAAASLARAARQERAATPKKQREKENDLEAPDLSVLKALLASAKLKSPSLKAALHAWVLDCEGKGDAVGSKRARG